MQCEAKALAILNKNWIEEPSKAMLISSYIDSIISNELEQFKKEHLDIFLKNGELKAEYKNANEIIKQMQQDEFFVKYLNGEHQVIMTGEINGVPVKIKIDSYFKDKCIVDLKCIASMDLIFNEKTHQRENFIDYYRLCNSAELFIKKLHDNKQAKNYLLL